MKNPRLSAAVFLLVSTLTANLSLATEETKPPRPTKRVTFSSAHLDQLFYLNEGPLQFSRTALDGYSALFDAATQWATSPTLRIPALFSSLVVGQLTGTRITLAFHEFGHARAAHALGSPTQTYSIGGTSWNGLTSYWDLLGHLMITPQVFTSAATHRGAIQNPEPNFFHSSDPHILFSAGGINNSMLFARQMERQIAREGGHIANFQTYYTAKLDGFFYRLFFSDTLALSDLGSLATLYSQKGYGITTSLMSTYSALGLLGGTSIASLFSAYRYIKSGDPTIRPVQVYGFNLPEIGSYLNPRGISLEISTSYWFSSSLFAELAYEWITVGAEQHQITPGISFDLASIYPSLNQLWLSVNLVVSRGVGGSLDAEWFPGYGQEGFLNRLSYRLNATLFNRYTLFGQRNAPDLLLGTLSTQVFGSFSFHY